MAVGVSCVASFMAVATVGFGPCYPTARCGSHSHFLDCNGFAEAFFIPTPALPGSGQRVSSQPNFVRAPLSLHVVNRLRNYAKIANCATSCAFFTWFVAYSLPYSSATCFLRVLNLRLVGGQSTPDRVPTYDHQTGSLLRLDWPSTNSTSTGFFRRGIGINKMCRHDAAFTTVPTHYYII